MRDSRSFELSQGNHSAQPIDYSLYNANTLPTGSLAKKATSLSIPITSLKFPAVTAISYSTTRAKDWDDILTAHTDEAVARTWTMKDKRVGKHVFNVNIEKKKGATVGSVKVCP